MRIYERACKKEGFRRHKNRRAEAGTHPVSTGTIELVVLVVGLKGYFEESKTWMDWLTEIASPSWVLFCICKSALKNLEKITEFKLISVFGT